MKEALRGKRFSSDEEVTGAMQNWLKTQHFFFLTQLRKLVKSWNLCVEVEGGYIEKQYQFCLFIFTVSLLFLKSPFTFWLTLVCVVHARYMIHGKLIFSESFIFL